RAITGVGDPGDLLPRDGPWAGRWPEHGRVERGEYGEVPRRGDQAPDGGVRLHVRGAGLKFGGHVFPAHDPTGRGIAGARLPAVLPRASGPPALRSRAGTRIGMIPLAA